MKKIIQGLRYDTDKAIVVGEASKGCYPGSGDFSDWTATLYKTPRAGHFFLAGEGGPMTMFSRTISQNEWSGGEKLIPMSAEEALEWAEQYLDAEVIEEHFGEMIKDA